ncbi:conserved exported hypothetical protein [Verrucomicrobia bacterium]|nr:conserved exported hypothetical protein [Verrucomicrobiota bacterium]
MNSLKSLLNTALTGWVIFLCALCKLAAEEPWQDALGQMPLVERVTQLNRTNCVDLVLRSFQSNSVVKALIFMPGATDELYMFHRAQASLAPGSPSLFDAVAALTNQTLVHATFHPPFLLLHTDEDMLEPLIEITHPATVERLKKARLASHVLCNDRDWDFVQPILRQTLKVGLRPWRNSFDSWHFYRHSFAAWNLNGWEALEAAALAGKTKFAVRRRQVIFTVDSRVGAIPKLDAFPR